MFLGFVLKLDQFLGYRSKLNLSSHEIQRNRLICHSVPSRGRLSSNISSGPFSRTLHIAIEQSHLATRLPQLLPPLGQHTAVVVYSGGMIRRLGPCWVKIAQAWPNKFNSPLWTQPERQLFITKLVLLNSEVRCLSNEQGIVVLWRCCCVEVDFIVLTDSGTGWKSVYESEAFHGTQRCHI